MSSNSSKFSRSYTTPWTLRAYDALPGNPLWIGIGLMTGLLLIFLIGRSFVGGAGDVTSEDFRVAITQILLTAYSASAYACLLTTARKTTHDLSAVARHSPNWQTSVERVGRHPWWILLLVGAGSFLIVGISVTNATTPVPDSPWEWQTWSYDVYWHRATTVFFVWWIGCFCYVTVVESSRLSRLSEDIGSLDLLELHPHEPLIHQGLTNALLVIGTVSVMSLLGIEARYGPVLIGFWVSFIVLAWIGMMLPLRGIRRNIRAAKKNEIDWCRQALKIARDELKSGTSSHQALAEILAYKNLVESIRNWPFDNPTLVRFSLYLLIPLGSWLGGAFVERGLDLILS